MIEHVGRAPLTHCRKNNFKLSTYPLGGWGRGRGGGRGGGKGGNQFDGCVRACGTDRNCSTCGSVLKGLATTMAGK